MNLAHPRIFLARGRPQRVQKLVKSCHLEEVKVVTSSGKLNLTIGNGLGTIVGVVVSEVLMVIHEGEADGGQSTLKHGLRGGGSTQVNEAAVESETTGRVISSVDTTINQANQFGLKKMGIKPKRTKRVSATLRSVSVLNAGPSLSSAWRDGDEKPEPMGLIGESDELLELHSAAFGRRMLEKELVMSFSLKTLKSVIALVNDQTLLKAVQCKIRMEVVNVSGWCGQI
ncbi:hypothetical protein KCU64_g5, partial [Aureobasidium melanogenum]